MPETRLCANPDCRRKFIVRPRCGKQEICMRDECVRWRRKEYEKKLKELEENEDPAEIARRYRKQIAIARDLNIEAKAIHRPVSATARAHTGCCLTYRSRVRCDLPERLRALCHQITRFVLFCHI